MSLNARQRINITLPTPTVRLLNQLARKGDRSRLIDEAVHFFVQAQGRDNLRKMLRQGAIKRAKRDLALAEEWFRLDDES